jgi:hypothetical protein
MLGFENESVALNFVCAQSVKKENARRSKRARSIPSRPRERRAQRCVARQTKRRGISPAPRLDLVLKSDYGP